MRKIFPLLLILFLTACSQNFVNEGLEQRTDKLLELTQDEFLSIAFDNPSELDTSEVKTIVSDFLSSIAEKERSADLLTRSVSPSYSLNVASKSYFAEGNSSLTKSVSEDNMRLPVYEVNVTSDKGVGVIYVSADERNAEVITYIPQAARDEATFINSGSAFLVKWAKASAYERLLETEKKRRELHDVTVGKISKQLGLEEAEVILENIADKIVVKGARSLPVQSPSTEIISMVAPIVKTEWTQKSPYNLLLPPPVAPNVQSHIYAGCAVTAACQLMTAIKPDLTIDGIVIDWDYLSETPKIRTSAPQLKLDMVGKLHEWVFEQLEAEAQYDRWGDYIGTGVMDLSQISFYGDFFNHSEEYGSYDPEALLRSFNAGRPSLIRGQGHAWILDGYIIAGKEIMNDTKSSRSINIQYYDMFWHANFGWGGTANGYYKLKPDTHVEFLANGITYTTEKLFVYPGLYKR